jgi:uncharacterized protein involved in exopolysaccharide biosynthesis
VVSLLGLAAALIFGRHEYGAEAQVEVSPTFPGVLQGGSPPFNSDEEYRGFVQQQVAEIDSYATASAALELLGNDRRLWQESDESDRLAAERLVEQLDVSPILNTYLISVSLTGKHARGLAPIVNAVVTAYLQRQQRRELEGSDQRVQLLVRQRTALEKESETLRARESQLAGALGVSTFGPGFTSPYDKMLGNANAALDSAHRATIEARAQLDAITANEQRVKSLEVDSAAEQMVASDPEVSDARGQLTKQREAVFLELEQLGPNHPGRQALRAEIENIDDELDRLDSGGVGRLSAILRRTRDTKAQSEISRAEAAVDQASRAESGIEQHVAELRTRAASFGEKYNEAMAVDRNLVRDSTRIRQIDEQVGLLRLETQSPGFVSLESAAMNPDMPVKGKRRKILAVFLLGALLLAIAVPTELDMLDPRIKTPEELEAIVGFPPFGAVLGHETRTARESLRRIALGIIRECRASDTRSFVLTPVKDGAGTNTLAFALASELNELGIRAIAIETSHVARESSECEKGGAYCAIHDTIDHVQATESATASAGNERRLRNTAPSSKRTASLASPSFKYVAAPTAVSSPSAPSSENGRSKTEVANTMTPMTGPGRSPGLSLTPAPVRGLLDSLRDRYDLVLFDTPPILASADAEMLIQMPAGAILVVRSGHDVARDIKAAVRCLERIAPPVVGTIITCASGHEAGAHSTDEDYSPQAIVKRWLAAM